MQTLKTQVLIIGGGATGTGIARDLALRGVESILVEQGDINAGASGGNHGLLHSGGRYVYTDQSSARECKEESDLLKKLAPNCIEETSGLFVAVEGDDAKYAADFPQMCKACNIDVKSIDLKKAREMEPALSKHLIAAYEVPDATIDPFKLSLENMYHSQQLGGRLLRYSKVTGFEINNNKIASIDIVDTVSGAKLRIDADQVVNAAGAWAGIVAGLAGIKIRILFSKGSLVITHNRLNQRVINRLRTSSSADILVPGGTVSILGTTSVRIDNLDDIRPTIAEVDTMIKEASEMIPALAQVRYIRAYAGVRPLVDLGSGGWDDRSVSRGFVLLDHAENGLKNFITITGGKLTTYRLMAEKTTDVVCKHLGLSANCQTRATPFPAADPVRWSEPGLAPKLWLKEHKPDDILLCECEMVPKSAVDAVINEIKEKGGQADLNAVGVRSRVGKGACQGCFCGARITSYLHDQGDLEAAASVDNLRAFIENRWKGERATLWDRQLAQAELLESMYCGFFGLECLPDSKRIKGSRAQGATGQVNGRKTKKA